MNAAATALVTGLALWISLPAGAIAQQSAASDQDDAKAPGMLTTRAIKKAPETLTLSVAPYDDSDLNLQLKKEFETLLTARDGVSVAPESKAGFLLLFEAKVVPSEDAPYRPSLGSLNAGSSGVDVNVNVWSNTQDSVLGGRQPAPEVGSNLFHINAILRHKSGGEVIWQGDIYHVLSGPETEHIARAMVAPLVEKIGQTVALEPFKID